jgi:hypothetical protein
MKSKPKPTDFLTYLKSIAVPQVKNDEFQRSLEPLFMPGKQDRKSGIIRFKFAASLAAAILAAVVLILVLLPIFAPPENVTLVGLDGPVSIFDRESGTRTKAAEGMRIDEGTTIQTAAGGKARLLFGGSSVIMGEQSGIEVLSAEQKSENENSMIKLQSGTIECEVNLKNRESSFIVATEYSLITVHGTHFTVILTPEQLEVDLKEGSITLDNYYSLKSSLEELKLKSAALYQRVSDILDTNVRRYDKKIVIKKDISEIKKRSLAVQHTIQRIMRTEAREEIDRSIEEIRDAIEVSSAVYTESEGLSPAENSPHGEPPASVTPAPQNPEENTSATASAAPGKKPETAVVFNLNGSMEKGTFAPYGWQQSEQNPAFKWTNSVSRTGRRSLQITSTHGEDKAIGWVYTLNQDIPYDKRIYLKVYIKCDAVSGQGVSLVLRADDTLQPAADAEIYASSQGHKSITGMSDWKEYTLVLPEPIHDSIKSITLYLIMLPGTKGTVYFDDISLYYKE